MASTCPLLRRGPTDDDSSLKSTVSCSGVPDSVNSVKGGIRKVMEEGDPQYPCTKTLTQLHCSTGVGTPTSVPNDKSTSCRENTSFTPEKSRHCYTHLTAPGHRRRRTPFQFNFPVRDNVHSYPST